MKRRRRPRALLSPWPLVCQNCGERLACAMCGAWQPLRHWTQEDIDDFHAELAKLEAGGAASFAEFFERDGE